MKRALITGITGQDGSYLAELLLAKDYEVHGLVRRSSSDNTMRLHAVQQGPSEVASRLVLHHGDLTDATSLGSLVARVRPDEVYNLGAMSDVRLSFEMPEYTAATTAVGAIRLLDAIRTSGFPSRFYQASTSEMFGSTPPPQHETTTFHPRSPYAAAKLHAHTMTVNHREAYGTYAVCGILFNHESPRRGSNFVTRKISRAVARIHLGLQDELFLGNLDAVRDWGYAPEYVEGMWRMLQRDEPDDYVLATGAAHSVRDFCGYAFSHVGLDWRDHVRHDDVLERPSEVDALIGDASKARDLLDWKARTHARELAPLMVEADLAALAGGAATGPGAG